MKIVDHMYRKVIDDIVTFGCGVCVRGRKTYELLNHTMLIPMECPVIQNPMRKLNYSFMAAEAHWILTGDNRLEAIAQYNSKMREFSDDGITLSGAYGVPWAEQVNYIIVTLLNDPNSRQAVATIWEREPQCSRDIPCTISLQFLVRRGCLHLVVNMRSNDIWLGTPYDLFSFSMMGWYILIMLRQRSMDILPGMLYLNAGSRHLYEADFKKVDRIITIMDEDKIGDFKDISIYDFNTPDDILVSLRKRMECPKFTPFTQML